MDIEQKSVGMLPVELHEDAVPPVFCRELGVDWRGQRDRLGEAVRSWLASSPSVHTRVGYASDLRQFLRFGGIEVGHWEKLAELLPSHVSAWRDSLAEAGYSQASIRRKIIAVRSLFTYLQTFGYTGANPAHGKFVKTPAPARDGKTIALSPHDCRMLLDAPDASTPIGIRDRAILATLAYSACRVGELVRLKIGDYRRQAEHHVLNILGKGGKERVVPLHLEAVEYLREWMEVAGITDEHMGPLFRSVRSPRGSGRDGFLHAHMTVRAIEYLVTRYVRRLGLPSGVSVHSLRVTALTTARHRGADIIDLQDFAGHADPRTTLAYIRSQERLSKSPTYVLRY
jgi:integrase/recombinase XerD